MVRFRKIVMGILFLSMMLSITSGNVYAAQTDDIISFEDYYSSLKAEYAKYGIIYEVLQTNDDFVFTNKLLEEQLATTKLQGKESLGKPSETIIHQLATTGLLSSFDNNISILSQMPVTITDISDHVFKSPSGMGEVGIRLKSTATYDAQNGQFFRLNSYSHYQQGTYVNLKSCSIVSYGGTNNAIKHAVSGLLTIEYKEQKTGLIVGYTSTHSVTHYWFS